MSKGFDLGLDWNRKHQGKHFLEYFLRAPAQLVPKVLEAATGASIYDSETRRGNKLINHFQCCTFRLKINVLTNQLLTE